MIDQSALSDPFVERMDLPEPIALPAVSTASSPPPPPPSSQTLSIGRRFERALLDACAVSTLANSMVTYSTAGMSDMVLTDFAIAGFFMGARAIADTRFGKYLQPQYNYYMQAALQIGNAGYLMAKYHDAILQKILDSAPLDPADGKALASIALFLLSGYGNIVFAEKNSLKKARHMITQTAYSAAFVAGALTGNSEISTLMASCLTEDTLSRETRNHLMTERLRRLKRPMPPLLATMGNLLTQGYFLAGMIFSLAVGESHIAKTIFLGDALANVLRETPRNLIPYMPVVLFAGAFAAGAVQWGWQSYFSAGMNSDTIQNMEGYGLGAALLSIACLKQAYKIHEFIIYGFMRVTAARDYPSRNPLTHLRRGVATLRQAAEAACVRLTLKNPTMLPLITGVGQVTERVGTVFRRTAKVACALLNPKKPTSFPLIIGLGCLEGGAEYLLKTPGLLPAAALTASMALYAQAVQSMTFRDEPLKLWGILRNAAKYALSTSDAPMPEIIRQSTVPMPQPV